MKKQMGFFHISGWSLVAIALFVGAIGYGAGRFIEFVLHLFTLSINLA